MLSIVGKRGRACGGTTRREVMRLGGLGAVGLGLGLGGTFPAAGFAAAEGKSRFGQARHILLIHLFGGSSQLESWDPKPDAPADARGEFQAIPTNVPGIQVSELAPGLAKMAERFALVRSVTHLDNTHDSAMYTAFTGWQYPKPGSPQPSPTDHPSHGSLIASMRPPSGCVPPLVSLGGYNYDPAEIAGQRGGFLGPRYDPFPITANPAEANFKVPELVLSDELAGVRLQRRRTLLQSVESTLRLRERTVSAETLGGFQGRALELVTAAETRAALDIQREPAALRDRYGRTGFGQRLLLARRLFEVGVPCVTVRWLDGDQSWDYHSNNFPGHKKSMAVLDTALSGLLEDLHQRGMLDTTLVVVAGEFGRTAKINPTAGRDHWAQCYSVLLAGGGIQGGRVAGKSDKTAQEPVEDPAGPWDIAATMYHLMGVDPAAEVLDLQNRPMRICHGEVIRSLV